MCILYSNVRREDSRHFRNKKKEYLKAKINEFETNSKNKNFRDLYRGINDFKKGHQPRTNVVKYEKGDLFADCHSIWLRGGVVSLSKILTNILLSRLTPYAEEITGDHQCAFRLTGQLLISTCTQYTGSTPNFSQRRSVLPPRNGRLILWELQT
jgi:hypothetical protein